MEQSIRKQGLLNWLLLLGLGSAGAAVARYADSATGIATAAFMAVGLLVALTSYFQMRLEDRERLEQLEYDELKKSASSGTLFAEQAAETFPARRSREQFERFIVPGLTCFVFLLQAGSTYFLWKYVGDDKPASLQQSTAAMALFGLFALVFFQVGKYSAVLARIERQRLLRPQASYLLLGALLNFVGTLVEASGWAGYPKVDVITARALAVVLGLVAAETLFALVFELYRPRVKGQAEHPLYESRLIGLLGQPGGLITTAAQALDYQFGFKVSETWVYRFLEQALAWLVLLQAGLLLLSSCFVVIEPGEQALLERNGAPVAGREVLDPGPHLKLPWPIDRIHRYKTEAIQSFTVGIVDEEHHEERRVVLWTKDHAKEEFPMLVASRRDATSLDTTGDQAVPVNLLAVNLPVQYQIRDLRAFAYNHADAGTLLQRIAYGEVTRYLVSVDLNDIMSAGRQKAGLDLQKRIQERADDLKLGVRILFVGLQAIHPPVKVAPDFEKVIGAMQEKEATNYWAQAYKVERIPMARAEAARTLNNAEMYRAREMAYATGTAARFTNQLTAYNSSKEVYKLRAYLDALVTATATPRKYVVVPTNTHDVVTYNLEDKLRADLLDVTLPAARKP